MIQLRFLIIILIMTSTLSNTIIAQNTIIHGIVKNSVTHQVAILRQDCRIYKEVLHHATIDVSDKFHLEFELETPGYFDIRLGEIVQPLFLSPGDSINILCNMNFGLSSLQITGSNQGIQNYLTEFNIASKEEVDYNHKLGFELVAEYRALAEDKIMDTIDLLIESRFKRLSKYSKSLPKSFVELEYQRIRFGGYVQKMYSVEKVYSRHFSKKEIDQRFYALDKSNAINFAFNQDIYLNIPSYRQTSFEVFRSMKADQHEDSSALDNNQKAVVDFQISKSFAAGLTLHYLRYMIICDQLSQFKTQDEVLPYLHLFMNSDAPVFLKQKAHAAFTAHFFPDESYYFTEEKFLDVDNKLRSFSEFKGQHIVIGFYSNLLFDPLRDFSFLQEEYYNLLSDRIAFIHLNIDNDYQTWQNVRDPCYLPRENWWVPKDKTDMFNRLRTQYLQSFIIIDKSGEMIYHSKYELKYKSYRDALDYIRKDIEKQG